MAYYRLGIILLVVLLVVPKVVSVVSADPLQKTAQLKAGLYFPTSKSFDVGTGFDLVYSVRQNTYVSLEAAIGYYRSENGTTGFLSALPLTVSARATLPLQYINVYLGGGIGTYYKMAGGTTELPAEHSEFSFGYHANSGIEFPASNGLSLLLDGKYMYVGQDKFKSYDISHGGLALYGGFALIF